MGQAKAKTFYGCEIFQGKDIRYCCARTGILSFCLEDVIKAIEDDKLFLPFGCEHGRNVFIKRDILLLILLGLKGSSKAKVFADWLLSFSPHRVPIPIRGQNAWRRIKATAAEQRGLWRQVGEALAYGRMLHPADQKFSQWCKEHGFGDMDNHDRADAMWLVAHWTVVCDGHIPHSHPSRIRRWFNEQQSQASLPDDLKDTSIETKVVPSMDTCTAEKVGKLARRAKS